MKGEKEKKDTLSKIDLCEELGLSMLVALGKSWYKWPLL